MALSKQVKKWRRGETILYTIYGYRKKFAQDKNESKQDSVFGGKIARKFLCSVAKKGEVKTPNIYFDSANDLN